jgi:hypothetical protein
VNGFFLSPASIVKDLRKGLEFLTFPYRYEVGRNLECWDLLCSILPNVKNPVEGMALVDMNYDRALKKVGGDLIYFNFFISLPVNPDPSKASPSVTM